MKIRNEISFSGRIFFVGETTDAIRETLTNNTQVQNFIAGRKNLLVKTQRRRAVDNNSCDTFRLSFKSVSSRKNWFLRLWDLTSPPAKLAREFYTEREIVDKIENYPLLMRKVIKKVTF
ncbi:MAG: hypothetical protein K6A44_06165 [bacterium]|nr:hypothetical protein [bacterium]